MSRTAGTSTPSPAPASTPTPTPTSTPVPGSIPAAAPAPAPAPVAGADAVTAPLVDLAPGGTPALINYTVPEPMSFSGRNFIDMQLPADAFIQIQAGTPTAPSTVAAVGADPAQPPAAVQAAPTLQVPHTVVLAGDGHPDGSPLAETNHPMTDRLAALRRADIAALGAAGKQVHVYRAISGQLDYRVTDAPDPAVASTAGLAAGVHALTNRLAIQGDPTGDGGGDLGGQTWRPVLHVFIDSPADNSALPPGPAAGITVPVTGRWTSLRAAGSPTITVAMSGAKTGPVTVTADGHFSAWVTVSTAGQQKLTVTGSIQGTDSDGNTVTVGATATATISVVLNPSDTGPAPTLPTVVITTPRSGTLVLSQQGSATTTVTGRAGAAEGTSVGTVTVAEGGSRYTATPAADGTWSVPIVLSGTGGHTITATGTDATGRTSAPASVAVTVSDQQPFRRLLSRLLIVETLNLSSYLGDFGAGRVVKTYTLMPGESATVSVKSYTRSTQEQKAASSIIDSNATDCADDFTDALNQEQTSTAANAETQNYKVAGTASAHWGWGSASISADYSGSANATRQEAVKNVATATRKHSLRASTNRNVTVNTEYQVQQETGTEESTTRTISNINVSRALNLVFRQMNQRHVTLIHLTNVRIAHYTEDLMLDGSGQPAMRKNPDGTDYVDPATGQKVLDIRPTYREVSLPELQGLLSQVLQRDYQMSVQQAILNALSGIPDYQDDLQRAYEWVVPVAQDGAAVPQAKYLRFPHNLSTTFTDPETHSSFTVPGIVLAYDHITMRCEGLLVSCLLDPGNGLDAYSQNLQTVALAERQVAVAERQAQVDRMALAQKIVAAKDDAAANIFAKVFPPASATAAGTSPNGKA